MFTGMRASDVSGPTSMIGTTHRRRTCGLLGAAAGGVCAAEACSEFSSDDSGEVACSGPESAAAGTSGGGAGCWVSLLGGSSGFWRGRALRARRAHAAPWCSSSSRAAAISPTSDASSRVRPLRKASYAVVRATRADDVVDRLARRGACCRIHCASSPRSASAVQDLLILSRVRIGIPELMTPRKCPGAARRRKPAPHCIDCSAGPRSSYALNGMCGALLLRRARRPARPATGSRTGRGSSRAGGCRPRRTPWRPGPPPTGTRPWPARR